MKEPYQIKKEELSNVYKNNNFKQGLTSKEALERLNADGPNTLEVKQTPKWKLFLRQFNNVVIERGKLFNLRKPTNDHWYNIAIGTSDAHIDITLVNKDSLIGVELYITDNKELFDKLYSRKDEIEEELGFQLDWRRLDNSKASRIVYHIKGLNFDNHSNYDELMNKTIDLAVLMRNTFKKYI